MNITFLRRIKFHQLIWLLCFICGFQNTYGQAKDSISLKDSVHKIHDSPRAVKKIIHDTTQHLEKRVQKVDTLKPVQKRDTSISSVSNIQKDTVRRDTILPSLITASSSMGENAGQRLAKKIKYINLKDAPVFFLNEKRNVEGKEFLFYSIFLLLLLLGFLKTFYSGYFNNLFRVFFNTLLRHSQLTGQFLQA